MTVRLVDLSERFRRTEREGVAVPRIGPASGANEGDSALGQREVRWRELESFGTRPDGKKTQKNSKKGLVNGRGVCMFRVPSTDFPVGFHGSDSGFSARKTVGNGPKQ